MTTSAVERAVDVTVLCHRGGAWHPGPVGGHGSPMRPAIVLIVLALLVGLIAATVGGSGWLALGVILIGLAVVVEIIATRGR